MRAQFVRVPGACESSPALGRVESVQVHAEDKVTTCNHANNQDFPQVHVDAPRSAIDPEVCSASVALSL